MKTITRKELERRRVDDSPHSEGARASQGEVLALINERDNLRSAIKGLRLAVAAGQLEALALVNERDNLLRSTSKTRKTRGES